MLRRGWTLGSKELLVPMHAIIRMFHSQQVKRIERYWRENAGGPKPDMVVSLVPNFNRCVIFNTSSDSFHGNPEIVNHPNNISRKSIALYYYTSTWNLTKRDHTTQFKARSGTADKTDWSTMFRETVSDLTPPVLLRSLKKLKRSAE